MFSRLFKIPKSSLQPFREECAETCQIPEGCRQLSAETFSSLPIIRKVGLTSVCLPICLGRLQLQGAMFSHSHSFATSDCAATKPVSGSVLTYFMFAKERRT